MKIRPTAASKEHLAFVKYNQGRGKKTWIKVKTEHAAKIAALVISRFVRKNDVIKLRKADTQNLINHF